MMTYMQSNLAFAGGIQELSVDEIGFVSGGVDAYDSGNMRRRPEILDKNADPMRNNQGELKSTLRGPQVSVSAILAVGAALTGTTAAAACLSPLVATPPGAAACAAATGVTAVLGLASAGAGLLGK